MRNWGEATLANGLVGVLGHAPLSLANALGQGCARLLDTVAPRLRRTAYTNLTFAYPDRDAAWRVQIVDGVYRSIGRLLVAMARFPQIDRSNVGDWIHYEGFEHYEQAKARGRGVLFATAHLGNWELSAFAHALLTEKMNIVVRPLDNPAVDDLVETRRALSGNTLLSKRDFARTILYALRDNEPVGILVDQNSAGDNSAWVPFFDKPACTNLTFAKLAARSGAAVIPGFALWSEAEKRYVLRFYPEVAMTGDAVEVAIREYPDLWLLINRRWKTRPEGEAGIY